MFPVVLGYANDKVRIVSSEGSIAFPVSALINCQYNPNTDSLSVNLTDTILTFQTNQSLFLDFWDEQYNVLDPDSIPDNEIWYISGSHQKLELRKTNVFGTEFESHTYENGRGIIKFKGAVKNIPSRMFQPNDLYGSILLESILLPRTVETIQSSAFYNTTLQEITIQEGVHTIDSSAFQSTSLRYIKIPKSVKKFGKALLSDCPSLIRIIGDNPYVSPCGRMLIVDSCLIAVASAELDTIVIPDNVNTIGYAAFQRSTHIETNFRHVVFSNNIQKIESLAFRSCNLADIKLPENLKQIGYQAFSNNLSLKKINIPQSVQKIEEDAFGWCHNLSKFTGKFASEDGRLLIVDGNIVAVAAHNLTNISIPRSVRHIGRTVFSNIQTLENVVMSNSVVSIGDQAFALNDKLKNITISDSVVSLGFGIVSGCGNLETINGKYASSDKRCLIKDGVLNSFAPYGLSYYEIPSDVKVIGQCAFAYIMPQDEIELKTIKLPENLSHIGWNAFELSTIEEIILPYSVLSIGREAFYAAFQLKSIFIQSFFPPSFSGCPKDDWEQISRVFGDIHPEAKFYVPEPSVETYKNMWPWWSSMIEGYKFDNIPNDCYLSTDYSLHLLVDTLQTATAGNGIDIVFIGDAYSDRQIADSTYYNDLKYLYENLFTEEPYKSYKEMFNVLIVNVVSPTEGYEHGSTALGGFFGEGTYVGGNDLAVIEYAKHAISEEQLDESMIVVAMNSNRYAGTCYMYYPEYSNNDYGAGLSISYFPKGGNAETFAQLLHHEALGHGFAKLEDEYAYESNGQVPVSTVDLHKEQQTNWGWWKNIDFTNDSTTIRWSRLLLDERYHYDGLGAFEGGLTYWTGVWRPTENSIMRDNTGGFNAPSREAIYYRIHKLAYGEDWEYDYEKFVEWDAKNRKMAESPLPLPSRDKIENYIPTHPPVIKQMSWREAVEQKSQQKVKVIPKKGISTTGTTQNGTKIVYITHE